MEYIPNYPIAAYRIDEEVAGNTAFKAFVEVSSSKMDYTEFVFADSIIKIYRTPSDTRMPTAST